MSCKIIQNNIQSVLEDSSAVYSMVCETSGNVNTDYAGYACHVALNRFREILNKPELTGNHLENMMRRAARQHAQNAPNSQWSSFMAQHINETANMN